MRHPPYENKEAAFLSHVKIAGPDECWEWQGNLSRFGYGRIGGIRFGLDCDSIQAHRLSFFLFKCELPPAVLHECDNRRCVNPNHLFKGTKGINNTDRKQKGRNADRRGIKNTNAILDEEKVRQIRSAKGTGREIALRFQVSEGTVSMVRSRKIWTHVV